MKSPIDVLPSVDEIIAWDIPGKSRTLTREEIAAEYGQMASRQIRRPVVAPEPPSRFVVHRVFDDGRKDVVSGHRTHEEAAAAADKARDNMTDAECGGDFTYLPGKRAEAEFVGKKVETQYEARKEMNKNNFPGRRWQNK